MLRQCTRADRLHTYDLSQSCRQSDFHLKEYFSLAILPFAYLNVWIVVHFSVVPPKQFVVSEDGFVQSLHIVLVALIRACLQKCGIVRALPPTTGVYPGMSSSNVSSRTMVVYPLTDGLIYAIICSKAAAMHQDVDRS